MNRSVLTALVCLPTIAAAERIWCGTSLDLTREPVWRPMPTLPAIVTHVDNVHFAGERDPRARGVLAGAATACGRAGASWSVTLVVAPNGTVVDANVVGAETSCVRDSLRRLRFSRGAVRTISARLSLVRQ
jgi:hypothetical protein